MKIKKWFDLKQREAAGSRARTVKPASTEPYRGPGQTHSWDDQYEARIYQQPSHSPHTIGRKDWRGKVQK